VARMKPNATPTQVTLAFVAASMFFLAGIAEIVAGLMIGPKHHPVFVAIGAMFSTVGCLWLVIAAKFKTKARGPQ
jgi:succinate-acetate transporter protein